MRTIEKTDYAYSAIDKINKNFADLEAGMGGGTSEIIEKGDYIGRGTSFVRKNFDVAVGDFVRIEFPNGNWTDPEGVSTSYAKLAVGYLDGEDVTHTLFLVNIGQTIQPGYDIYISPALVDVFSSLYIYIRAQTDDVIPFVLRRISAERIKDYYRAEMLDTVNKVRARISTDCVTFAVVTDIHYRSYQNGAVVAPYLFMESCINIAELHRHVRLDNVVCMGDIIDGRTSAIQSIRDADDSMGALSGIETPFFFSLGNHDVNRYYSENAGETGDRILTPTEIYSLYFQPLDERRVAGAENGMNYYRDIDRLKVRLVVLKSCTDAGQYAYSSATADWFESLIADTPNDWKVVVFTHVPLLPSHGYNGASAFNAKINTALQSDKVITLFEGHVHGDNVFATPNWAVQVGCNKSVNFDPTSSAWPEDELLFTRTGGTATEDLWDACVVDPTNALLSCIRFGAGIDRYIHYNPVTVAAGGSATLTPSIITAVSWETRASETAISIASGVVSVADGTASGTRLMAAAKDSDGNMEIWCIKVS